MARSRSKTPSVAKPPAQEDHDSPEPFLDDEDILEFTRAIDHYRRQNNRPFPSWSEVLRILHSLGYKKVEAK